ncbi:hypothetical protein [Brucella anthropi]|uniref:hypothetical protein n=1 Tax=Brucella anthropi TaxID=529 RepID=UPI0039885652
MSEERTMQLPPKGKIEWNLNTLLQLAQIAFVVIGGVTLWVNQTRDITDLQAWRTEAVADIKNLKEDVRKVDTKVEGLQYRTTSTEQQVANMNAALKEIQAAVNQQTGDVRLVREILQRLEAGQKRGG